MLKDYWSYSLWSAWKGCKLSYKYRKIDKVKVPGTWATNAGTTVHKLAEGYLNGTIKSVPKALTKFKRDMVRAKGNGALPEVDLGVSNDLSPSHGTDWNRIWCRGAADFGLYIPKEDAALFVDYKTGNRYDDHQYQADMYGFLGFCHYDVEVVKTSFWYLKTGEKDFENTYTLTDYRQLKKFWLGEHKKMQATKRFPKTKDGWRCGWCVYNKKNGGPCNGV